MPTEIVIQLSTVEQEYIHFELLEAAKTGSPVHVMIQDGGLKLKVNHGIWTPPMGKLVRR